MKCPVCGKENKTMLCLGCGFDSSRDYLRYPTFGAVGHVRIPSNTASKEVRKEKKKVDSVLVEDRVSVFGTSKYKREQIKSVTFVASVADMPVEAWKRAWDASEDWSRTILAGVVPNGALYDLYIGGNGEIRAGASCLRMFEGYVNVERISLGGAFNTSGTKNMMGMFWECENLTQLDLSGMDTSRVQDMSFMFWRSKSLTELDLSGFNTSNVQRMDCMFSGCEALTELDLSGFDTSKVQDMSSMFWECKFLTKLDLSGFNTSNVQNMHGMFLGCASLSELDVSGFNTSNVQDMGWMFRSCGRVKSLDVSGFDTSKVRDMSEMFSWCWSLTSLDLTGFDTTNVESMYGMFEQSRSLMKLKRKENFVPENADTRKMFDVCPADSVKKKILSRLNLLW